MSRHETLTTLRQLKEFAEEATRLAKGRSREDLAADLGLRRHAERVIELIGEACNRLPEKILEKHSEIPWRQIVGMRNWLAHGYDGVDYDILWDAVSRHVSDLLAKIDPLIADTMRTGSEESGHESADRN
jgi:uncharacterized protein with HEPN domain